jgi:hypothetical protein
MIDPSSEIARTSAARLNDLDPDLATAMDQVLAGQERPRRRSIGGMGGLDAGATLTLASFVLSLVQFGWSVYRDQRRDQRRDQHQGQKEEVRDVLIRRLRMRIEQVDGGDELVPPGRRDRILEVVAEEILSLEGSRP